MKPDSDVRGPEAPALAAVSIHLGERHLLDPELVAEARKSLIENHELLCEPACSSDLENDILLEL